MHAQLNIQQLFNLITIMCIQLFDFSKYIINITPFIKYVHVYISVYLCVWLGFGLLLLILIWYISLKLQEP